MSDASDNFELSSRSSHRQNTNRWGHHDGDDQPAHVYAPSVDAERRRQQLLQLMLIFSMLFIMLTSPNQQQPAQATPSDQSGAPASPMSREYASTLQRVLQDKRDDRYIYPVNASGIYRGDWVAPVQSAPSTNATPATPHAAQRVQGKMFMQLRSLGVADVNNFEFIYGVVKLYGAGQGSADLLFPLQGVSVPLLGIVSLMSTPLKSHVLFMQLPKRASGGAPSRNGSAEPSSPNRRLSSLAASAAPPDVNPLYSVRESARGESALLSGDSQLFLRELRAPPGERSAAPSARRRLTLSANDSAIVNWLAVGDTGVRIFLVDLARVAALPPAAMNESMRRCGMDADFLDRTSVAVVGEQELPTNFKSLQASPSQTGANGLASSCPFSLILSSQAIGESRGDSARAQAAMESFTSIIEGNVRSGDCGLEFNVTSSTYHIKLEKLESKARDYSFMATAVCLIQIALLVLQLKHAQNPAVATKISIAGMCAHALLDAALCVGHLLLCAAVPKIFFGLLIWISILKLFIFCIFEMRTIITIYQARYSHELQVEGWEGLRRRLASVHLRFYAVFFVLLMLFSALYTRPTLLVPIFYSVWVPQIIYNAVHDTRRALHPSYVVGMSLSRLLIPLYFLWCPKTFLKLIFTKVPNTFAAGAALIVYTAAQVAVLLLQDKLGSRFFLPSRFQAHKYDYYRAVPRADESFIDEAEAGLTAEAERPSSHECVICYNDIALSKGRYMVTPCEHLFHTECLKQWLEIKLECPVCRHALEPCDD